MNSKYKNSSRWNFRFLKIFFRKGAIHGLPHVATERHSVVEKTFWLLLTMFAVFLSIKFSLQSLDRYRTKSTVISIERDYHYWNTSIPSATICPMKRLDYEKFEKYFETIPIEDKTDQEKRELFDFLESLANSTYFNFNDIKEFPSTKKYEHFIDPKDYMYLIYNLTEDLLDIPTDDESEFSPVSRTMASFQIHSQQILSEWGICYTTNNYLIDKMSTTNLLFGQPPPMDESGNKTAKYIRLFTANIFDGIASYAFLGFTGPLQIYIHDSYEVINFEKRMKITNTPYTCEIFGHDIAVSEDLEKSTTVEQRQCRFSHESNLKYFPVYTRNLCRQECRIELALKFCKCIPHFYPNRNMLKPVCSYKVLKDCLSGYSDIFQNLNGYFLKNSTTVDDNSPKCNCLPNCKSFEFYRPVCVNLADEGNQNLLHSNGVIIKIEKYPKMRYHRQIIFTITDLLVSIGGTVGFFLGSSFLSAVEIVYYFTVRLMWYGFGYRE